MGMGIVLPLEKPGRLVERVCQARGSKYNNILRARCLGQGEQRQRNRDDGRAKFGGGPHRPSSGPHQGRHRPPTASCSASSAEPAAPLFFNDSPVFAGNLQALTFPLSAAP
jgi:hypothetical protein